jgi:mannonate dehydratase
MYIQDLLDWSQLNNENLSFFKAIGVDYLCLNVRGAHKMEDVPDMREGRDSTDFFKTAKAKVESHGLVLYSIFMGGWNEISLAKPDRDEKIQAWCKMLKSIGAAGIPVLGYNFKPMGNFRTTSTKG